MPQVGEERQRHRKKRERNGFIEEAPFSLK
jgi:hypothetical protein